MFKVAYSGSELGKDRMNEEKISIIVPVYNVERELDRCITSIAHQTYRNLEIILIDDGSSDHCPALCDEYAKMDQRVKVIHKKMADCQKQGILVCHCQPGHMLCT